MEYYDDTPKNDDVPYLSNNTIHDRESENTLMFIMCGLIIGFSIFSACCKYAPTVKQKMISYTNRTNLHNYVNQRQLEEQGTTDNTDICSICIEPFVPRQLSLTLHCNHKFHTTCILDWLNQELSCPMCRTPIQFN
tara:strand:- start:669 stop:1076 length:408 start_codon:yes stop_codon:yes gene_type:complete